MRRLILPAALLGLAGCQEAPAPKAAESAPPKVVQSAAPSAAASAAPAQAAPASAPTSAVQAPAGAALPAVAIGLKLTEEQQAQAKVLATAIRNDALERRARRDRTNAALFLHIAASAETGAVVAKALEAAGFTHVRKPRPDRPERGVDADYATVVRSRLDAKDGAVRVAAIGATRLLIGGREGKAAWIDTMIGRLDPARPAFEQLALLKVLHAVRAFQLAKDQPGPIKGKVVKAVLTFAEGSTGPTRVAAIDLLARVAYPGLPQADVARKIARGLIADPDAAARGSALALLAALTDAKGVGAVAPTLLEAAKSDAAPFVRGVAVAALGKLKYAPAAHVIVPLLEDRTNADLKVGGWTDATGAAGSFSVRTGMGHDLAGTAFRAIRLIAGADLKIEAPADRSAAGVAAARVAAAKAWYAANKATLKTPK